jgi:hypothetical protein
MDSTVFEKSSRNNFRAFCFILLFATSFFSQHLFAQTDLNDSKLKFTGDFRFRIEEDWNSRKSDGTYRDDRSRLRYRLRFGFNYQLADWASFGMRLRTGYIAKQQDPHLTLGDGFGEFSDLPINFEKLFFQFNYQAISGWLGKNTFPFEKQNELFWSDNVYPEGVFLSGKFAINSSLIESISIRGGHFITRSKGESFGEDNYFQGLQILSTHFKNRLRLFPSYYYFNNVPNIPDGQGTYGLQYKILHFGGNYVLFEKPHINIGLDLYKNLADLQKNDSIPQNLRKQNKGIVANIGIGEMKETKDWTIQLYYTNLERYAVIDFFAQNDWTRWDYSGQGSPDGRLTNFQGVEVMGGYVINKYMKLKVRYFMVDQIISYGEFGETGNRIRLDLDVGF